MIKSSLLSFALMFVVFAGFAQHSTLSNNKPTAAGDGYLFDFKGTTANNCPNLIPYDQWFMSTAYSVTSIGSDTAVIGTNGDQEGWHRVNFHFYDGNCNPITINLKDNQNVELVVRSSVAVPQCMLIFFNSNGDASDMNPIVQALTPGLNTITATDIDFRKYAGGKLDSTQVAIVGLYFRVAYNDNDGSGGADPSVIGNFHVAHMKFGDQTGLSTTTGVQAQDITSEINTYPTPCSGSFNLSYDHNEDGTVYISTLTGNNMMSTSVEAGAQNVRMDVSTLPKGMYILTVKTASAVGTRKIIVE